MPPSAAWLSSGSWACGERSRTTSPSASRWSRPGPALGQGQRHPPARAKRQQRIEDEFENGRSFAATEGFSASLGASQKSIAEVQRAVNALSDAGAALSSGDLGQAQSAAGGGWVQDFQSAAASLDSTAKLSGEYETVVKGLGGIRDARDVDSARQSFVVAVTALQGWAADTGIASKLEGL